jgi:hypothetical protein
VQDLKHRVVVPAVQGKGLHMGVSGRRLDHREIIAEIPGVSVEYQSVVPTAKSNSVVDYQCNRNHRLKASRPRFAGLLDWSVMLNVFSPGAAGVKPRPLQGCRMPLLSLCLACAVAAWAAPSESAIEIMREVQQRGFAQSQSYDGTIEVVASNGKVLKRSWQLWREGNHGESKLLLRFNSPPEMLGVAVLILKAPNATPEQWLYTPSIQRERRLAAQDRSQRFMGTDLSHEDFEDRPVEDYDYDLIGEESFAGQAVYKIKAVCKDRKSTQYSQLILYVRKDILATTFTELYVDGKLRKTLLRGDWKQIQGIWTPLLLEMKDVARGSTTRIRASNVKYNVTFGPQWFSVGNLRKIQ